MDGEGGWWTSSGKIGLTPLSKVMGVDRQQQHVKDICNTLSEQFAFNASSENYSHKFNRHRLTVEERKIDLDTNDHYSNNDVFTLH